MGDTDIELCDGPSWYLQDDKRDQKDNQDDLIEFDFLKLSVEHIVEKRKIVMGNLLINPTQFLFELESEDPLDMLEPDLFQVVFPTRVITHIKILLTNSNPCLNQIYKGLFTKRDLIREKMFLLSEPCLDYREEEEKTKKYLCVQICMDCIKRPDSRFSSYGMSRLLPAYWFIIKQTQAHHLHVFLSTWFRDSYLEAKIESVQSLKQDLFTRADNDFLTDQTDLSYLENDDMETEEDNVLSIDQRKDLAKYFPPRCIPLSCERVFTTAKHGFSLMSLYRKCVGKEEPALLVIKTNTFVIFGAFLSHPPRLSDNFYGTGESWLFTFKNSAEKSRVFPWSGENNLILHGTIESLVVGSDNQGFGLWIEQSLTMGRTQSVRTFNNEILTEEEDFHINNLELWLFQH